VTWLDTAGAASGTGIETFCLQKTEYMSFNGTFYYGVSTAARGGSTYIPDEISVGTAWLYAQFAQGLLSTYRYAPGANRAIDCREPSGTRSGTWKAKRPPSRAELASG